MSNRSRHILQAAFENLGIQPPDPAPDVPDRVPLQERRGPILEDGQCSYTESECGTMNPEYLSKCQAWLSDKCVADTSAPSTPSKSKVALTADCTPTKKSMALSPVCTPSKRSTPYALLVDYSPSSTSTRQSGSVSRFSRSKQPIGSHLQCSDVLKHCVPKARIEEFEDEDLDNTNMPCHPPGNKPSAPPQMQFKAPHHPKESGLSNSCSSSIEPAFDDCEKANSHKAKGKSPYQILREKNIGEIHAQFNCLIKSTGTTIKGSKSSLHQDGRKNPCPVSPSKKLRTKKLQRQRTNIGSASKPSTPVAGPSDRVLRTRTPRSVPSCDENGVGVEDGGDSDWNTTDEGNSVDSEEDASGEEQERSDGGNLSAAEDIHSDSSNGPRTPAKNKRKNIKSARAKGQSYKTQKGKVVKARRRQPLKSCRLKCKERITDPDLDSIFEEYWALGSNNRRWQYVADRIDVTDKKSCTTRLENAGKKKKPRTKTQYYSFFIRGKKHSVCKACFMATLNETDRFVRTAVEKKMSLVSGVTPDDARGKAAPANKFADSVKEDITTHINSYPRYKSHYSRRHTDKYYLGANLTVASMHEAFNESADVKVSYVTYYRIFQSLGYKFKEPSLDTCKTCDKLQATLQFAATEDEREEARKLKDDHVNAADFAYLMKKADRELVKNDKAGNYMVLTFDLEQCLPTPALTTSSVFYLRQLWTYNLTVHDLKDGKAKAYMWAEPDGERGADQIASCVFTHVQENATEMVTHIILWSDQCAGQNKNSHVAAMFMFLIKQRPTLKLIDQKFLVSGHTRMECDADHSLIERKKKKWTSPIHHPRDWFTLVGSCSKKIKVREMKNSDFLAFSNLLSGPMVGSSTRHLNTSGDKFLWHDVQWLRFKKNHFGLIYYKTSLNVEEDFKTVSLRRKTGPGKYRTEHDIYVVPKCYDGPCRIAAKKKEDLLKLLHLIDPVYRPYYENLLTTEDIDADLDPDIPTSDEEVE